VKIISFTAENIKRLVVAHIEPNGNLVQITGKNGQGKTSVLDSIWWALSGADHIQRAPIRSGQNEAKIKLVLKGESRELIVTRKFKRKVAEDGTTGSDFTTSITVETVDGARFGSPQKMLDDLLGDLSFDPLAFARMPAKEQFDALRGFVPGFDFNAYDKAHQLAKTERTNVNRDLAAARAVLSQIVVGQKPADQPIDESELTAQLRTSGEHNLKRSQLIQARNELSNKIVSLEEDALKALASIDLDVGKKKADLDAFIIDIDQQIQLLNQRKTLAQSRFNSEVADIKTTRQSEAEQYRSQKAELVKKMAAEDPIPEPIDAAEIEAKLSEARQLNRALDQWTQTNRSYTDQLKKVESLDIDSKALTDKLDTLAAEKAKAIAAAKMPIEGLGFGDGIVTFKDEPFDQASDAEQLSVSVAIAAAMNPKLRIIRIRDGSLLDEEAMKRLNDLADAMDMQVWIERVDSSGKLGFVLEEGMVKQADAPAAEAAA
jgi:DNA repair exonuclease SbcCD ATPase subunit